MPRTSDSAADRSASEGEITRWIRSIEAGDQDAATALWQYCFPRLLSYSRKKLPGHLRRVLDEEDVALSAFKSFCIGAAQGRLGDIKGRDELWRLLYCISARKANGYVRNQTRQKRGGGLVAGESTFKLKSHPDGQNGIDQVADPSASPATLVQFANDCQRLFEMLQDDMLQTIAILRIEGYSVDEIASRVGCAKRSVERRLQLIRKIWSSADLPDDPNSTDSSQQ
jgi:DNA-directed RNA polymerase specialized sigma24 family protein